MVKPLKTRLNILQRRVADRNPGKGNRAQTKPLDEKGRNKGYYLGACNRSACLKPGANWYNHGSLAYYCERCAYELSNDSFNKREAIFEWGHDLCTEGQLDREAAHKAREEHRARLANMLKREQYLDFTKIPTGTFEILLRQEAAADEIKAAKGEITFDFAHWQEIMHQKVPDLARHHSVRAQEVRQLIYDEYVRHQPTTT